MKKNIYLIDYSNPLNNTGLNSYISILGRYLSEKNYIKLHFIWIDSKEYSQETIIINGNIEHIHLPYDITDKGEIREEGYKALKFITEITKNKNNIIFHFNWVNHTPFAWILKKEIKCKTLLTLHCITWRDLVMSHYLLFTKVNQYLKQSEKLSFTLKNKLYREIMFYNSVDHIICVTNDAKNVLQTLFEIPHNRITTIYNGIDLLKSVRQRKHKLRKKYGFSKNEKIILFAGRITKSKGVVELMRAFQILLEKYPTYKYRIVLCGFGDYDLLYQQIDKYSQVTLTGNIDKVKLYDFYKLADVGIIPSYTEQCSYTAIEMMANKLPVIVTDVGGLDELVNMETGLKVSIKFDSQKMIFDIDDLVDKMYLTIIKTDLSKKRAEKAYQKVKEKLTSNKMVEQTLQVYEKIIALDKKIQSQYSDLVSVIIPYYNNKKYVERCLQSVLDQTYENIEIILIDDGSQEKISDILYKFKDNRIKVHRNKKNEGVVFSLNKGIQLSQGKYIARLDADDFMHKDRIVQQVTFLEENQQYVMVGSNHILIDENENILQYVSYPQENEEIQVFKYFSNPISHPTTLFRSSILKKFEYNKNFLHCEDYKLWFDISKEYKIANIPQYTTYYRLHSEGISIKNRNEQVENTLELILNELELSGIQVSDEELIIHSAIVTRKGKQYFNSPEKIKKLKIWIDKILQILNIENNFIEEDILQYCDIWE